MRRRRGPIIVLLLCASLLSGCASRGQAATGSEPEKPEKELRISGSGTALPLMEILAEGYAGPGKLKVLPGLHSSSGIKGVLDGSLELGCVSRPLKPEEAEQGLTYQELSQDALAVATHSGVTIDSLTSAQVRDIYAGKYTNWQQLGGPDLPLVVLDRDESESAKVVLREGVLGKTKVTKKAIPLSLESDMIDSLQKTPGAIGFFSYGFAKSHDVPVNILALDGVEPSVAAIHDGSYKMLRPMGVVVANEGSAEAKSFVKWATTDEAVRLIEEKGFAAARR